MVIVYVSYEMGSASDLELQLKRYNIWKRYQQEPELQKLLAEYLNTTVDHLNSIISNSDDLIATIMDGYYDDYIDIEELLTLPKTIIIPKTLENNSKYSTELANSNDPWEVVEEFCQDIYAYIYKGTWWHGFEIQVDVSRSNFWKQYENEFPEGYN